MGHRGHKWFIYVTVYSYQKANRIITCQTHYNTSQTTPLFKQIYSILSILQSINHTSILAEKLTFPSRESLIISSQLSNVGGSACNHLPVIAYFAAAVNIFRRYCWDHFHNEAIASILFFLTLYIFYT